MDAKKNIDAMEAEEREAVEATEMTEDQEDDQESSLVLTFAKPYVFDGKEYTEVDLSGLEDATAADLSAVGKIVAKNGTVSPMPEMTMDFSQYMAARIAKMPVEFFKRIPAREAIKLKNIVTGFLYGGGGDS